MSDLQFIKEQVSGEDIYRLDGGTKYLPTLYIKHNKNWNSWMVFDYINRTAITNRIFKTQESCIEYISSYDGLSETALTSLQNQISTSDLSSVTKAINFANPQTLAQVMSEELRLLVTSQKVQIASKYDKLSNGNPDNIQLVYSFFNGLLSLFFIKNNDNHDEITFFIFNNGMISDYPAWKAVSVAMALFHQLIDYNHEQNKQKKLQSWRDSLIGTAVIDSNGLGLSFGRAVAHSNLILLQKVKVVEADGKKVADANQPITPFFICELSESKEGMLLEVRSVQKYINVTNEVFLIETENKQTIDIHDEHLSLTSW